MKKLIAVLTSLSLGACASGSVNIAPDVTAFENGVIADVVAACQVEPVLADIAALFPIYGPTASAAANAICSAVAKQVPAPTMALMVKAPSSIGPTVRLGVPPVIVHGVTVHFK